MKSWSYRLVRFVVVMSQLPPKTIVPPTSPAGTQTAPEQTVDGEGDGFVDGEGDGFVDGEGDGSVDGEGDGSVDGEGEESVAALPVSSTVK